MLVRNDMNAVSVVGGSRVRDVYSAVGDPTLRELIRILSESDELPLQELTAAFDMGRTALSRHLTVI